MYKMTMVAGALAVTLAVTSAKAQPLVLDEIQLDNITAGFVFSRQVSLGYNINFDSRNDIEGRNAIADATAEGSPAPTLSARTNTQLLPSATTSNADSLVGGPSFSINANSSSRSDDRNTVVGSSTSASFFNGVGFAGASSFAASDNSNF